MILLLSFTTSQADVVHIAVASNFTHPMKELITAFEKQSAHSIKASYGSSGKIYAQIKHGAPFDIFFSADEHKPALLFDQGLTHNQPFTYAFGALALWSNNQQLKGKDLKQKLQSGEFNKLALANPKLAPYGIAAMDVLEHLNLREATKHKWVKGENIAQTYQFVASANADLGFIALSQVIHQQSCSEIWRVPFHLYRPIRQDAVLLKNKAAPAEFVQFLNLPTSQQIIQSYGYEIHDIN
jgi:molybdate transport system substrate-binding protein